MPIKAYAAKKARNPLESFSYEPAELGPHDVDIAVTHCGICHSDIHLIDDDWGMSSYPFVPGHEVIGEVVSLGAKVKGLAKGRRVGVGWQSGSCMTCEACVGGDENLCSSQRATCVGRHGGFGAAIRVDGRFAFPIPDGLDSAAAAPLLCGGITVYSPIRELTRTWSRVGIIGIGGLGHLALQFARASGCEVTAFSTSKGKKAQALEFGAENFQVITDVSSMLKTAGTFDVILSTVTADLDWDAWLSLVKPKGSLVIVGAAPGKMHISPFSLIPGSKSVRGSAIGNRARIAEMLNFAARSGVGAKVETLPMSKVNDALDKVRANKARYRMVLEN